MNREAIKSILGAAIVIAFAIAVTIGLGCLLGLFVGTVHFASDWISSLL
jgi:hypothetical protein